ncbi:MAG: carboxypeptidase-like regulatory domain-containing protein [Acidobacteria bacterium]|nr:carboxypeptidase-like regulatory domain-containing protein [Acidobacteriota bacterium]
MICLFPLLFSSFFAPLTVQAQTGEITGRVISEDGAGLPNMIVFLNPVAGDRQAISGALESRTHTDLDGNFKFTELGPGPYSISVSNVRGYVRKSLPVNERQNPVSYRAGDKVTINMIKGGAISGRVTNTMGAPFIGVQVNAVMVRDAEGKPFRAEGGGVRRFTNDRGAFRLYGLQPGTYLVFARNNATDLYPTPYDGDVPTYHPSSTRYTAAEVIVTSGREAGGIDIRYRGGRGHTVSGVVIGGKVAGDTPAVSILLFEMKSAAPAESSYISTGGARGFTFSGLPDGEYAVIARTDGDDSGLASAPRRISLKGSDITGVDLKLLPLGSISGRVVVESPEVCDRKRKIPPEELSPTAIRDDQPSGDLAFLQRWNFYGDHANEKGEFMINDVDPGHYRIGMRLANENFYLKTITWPRNAPARRGATATKTAAESDMSRNGFALKQGEKLAGVKVTIAEGAASLRGEVVSERANAKAPESLRVHLIPAELNATDEILRYDEALVRIDGAFAFSNLAPGKYLLLVRAAPQDELSDRPLAPVAWNANERAKLRREAEALKIEVELKPCQRIEGQTVKYSSK